ncbi:(d)CMP kinase [Desulfohalobium retbaense]|uniref:Cytidylate kinase n=1 Tax=Desulfohalobium retbaense (strain ATCC 49708 / DSM 5692 / JCM 16813 / HR100) TaxID=485915 RepID=C8X4Y3_DESRD|nr:(d)CMP kinase [Desulfohalobium retbaense]ACV69480.1 cytidylate kinase [Desulfohalobium retbaense DSM 5692]
MPAKRPLIVTLDGPAGAGKSTVAKAVADALEIAYLDTGAMFRSVAWALGADSWQMDHESLVRALESMEFDLHGQGPASYLTLNGQPMGADIRTETVGMWASHIAQLLPVREKLKQDQRRLGAKRDLVAEGRDMGSVVFPEACCKFFLVASAEERARRRWEQLRQMGQDPSYEGLVQQIRQRDAQDSQREFAPLRAAEDAMEIDTTTRSAQEVVERIVELVQRRRKGTPGMPGE